MIAVICDQFGNAGASEQITVRFDTDVLNRLAGISGVDCYNLHKLRSTQPSVIHEIDDILRRLTEKLQAIDSFLKLEFTAESDLPIVVDIIEPATLLNRILNDKLEHESTLL